MATILALKQVIEQCNDKDPILGTTGKVKSVYDPETGDRDGETWKYQKLIIEDMQNSKVSIVVKVWGHEEDVPQSAKGRKVYIYGEGGKGVLMNLYKNKKEIKVTAAGNVSFQDPNAVGGEHHPAQQPAEASPEDDGREPDPSMTDTALTSTESAQRLAKQVDLAAQPQRQRTPAPMPPKRDRIADLIQVRSHLAKNGNAIKLSADELLRTCENFATSHGLTWNESRKQAVANQILDNMCDAKVTSLYLSLGNYVDLLTHGDINKDIEAARQRVQGEREANKQ